MKVDHLSWVHTLFRSCPLFALFSIQYYLGILFMVSDIEIPLSLVLLAV